MLRGVSFGNGAAVPEIDRFCESEVVWGLGEVASRRTRRDSTWVAEILVNIIRNASNHQEATITSAKKRKSRSTELNTFLFLDLEYNEGKQSMQVNNHGELRQWEREPVDIHVGLVLKGGEPESDISTTTLNISLSGVSVLTKLALVPRQELTVIIKGQFSRVIRARVVWVREGPSSNSVIAGLKFLSY